MDDSFDDTDFNPLQRYSESIQSKSLTLSPPKEEVTKPGDQSPVSEAGESEYAIVSGYFAMQSPVPASEGEETTQLVSEGNSHPKSLKSEAETKTNPNRPNETIVPDDGTTISSGLELEQNEQTETELEKNPHQQENEEVRILVDGGSTGSLDIIEQKELPPVPPPFFPPFTPIINPLHTVITDKPLKVDEYDQPVSDFLNEESALNDLPYKMRLKIALGSLTLDKWQGSHKAKTAPVLLSLRLFFMFYAVGILVLSCNSSSISSVFTSFNIWSWMIMLLWLILSIYVSIKKPRMTFILSSIGITLYLFFATYTLCTPIPLILKIVSNAPLDVKSWILELSLGSFGLIVHVTELLFNQINLSNALMPVFIAGNSLIWAILFGINASVFGNIGEAFPWMISHIIPGAILCLAFPVLCCWLCINGRR